MVQCNCFERRPDNYENKTATYTFLQSGRNDNHVGNVTWTADDIDYFVPMTWIFFEWRNFTIILLVALCHHCNTHFQSVAQWPKNVTQRKHAGVWVWFSDFSITGKSLNFGLLSPIAQPWPKLWGNEKKRLIGAFLASLCSQWPFSAERKRILGERISWERPLGKQWAKNALGVLDQMRISIHCGWDITPNVVVD